MRQLLARLGREDHGQDLIEYAFLAMFIALAVSLGLHAIRAGLHRGYANIGNQVSSAS